MSDSEVFVVSRDQLNDLVASAVSAVMDAQAAAREADRQAAEEALAAFERKRWAANMAAFFEGLPAAIEAERRARIEGHARRSVKVAIFDPEGVCIGVQEGPADAMAYQIGDAYTRLTWRPEWDGPSIVEMVRDGGVGEAGPVMRLRQAQRLPVPHLSDLPENEVAAELIGQAIGVFAANALLT
jgi:hypothetical protein